MTRTILDVVFLAGAIFATSATNSQQPKIPIPQVPSGDVDPRMPLFLVCAKECDDCARSCETCAAHCAKMIVDDKKEHLATLKLCQDCAAFCQAASRITSKDGPLSDLICTSCADACKRCGDACEKHSGDPIMKRCAEECRRCEKVCREMHKQTGAIGPSK
jgi:hypothetical protein